MRDYLGDMIARIKNGQLAGLPSVELHPHMPRTCYDVLNILYEEGYIGGVLDISSPINGKTRTVVKFKTSQKGGGKTIDGIFRISKPGRRIFLSTKALWKPRTSTGIFVLSTPHGVMTDREARLLNLGGEVLCGIF